MDSAFGIPEALRPYSRMVSVMGMQLHCYDSQAGSGTPVILIHGLGDEADSWRHVFAPLAAGRRVIALDLPGFGRSDRPRRAYTLAFFAQAIAGLMESLAIPQATLVGSSMGAASAQRLALAKPELVEQLILIGGCVPAQPGWPALPLWGFLAPGLGELAYTSLRRSPDAGYSTLQPYYYQLDALPEADRAFLAERVRARVFSDGQRRAFLSAFRWLAIERAFRANALRRLVVNQHTPTLLVWGEQDYIVPAAAAHAMAALLPAAQVQIIPECGHLPQQERPEQLLAVMEHVNM
jgi:pimeloyl-ACP methyl ester carboxylesterase